MSLDAEAQHQATVAAAAAAAEPAPLDPDYPFTKVAFDPFFFGLNIEPQKAAVAGTAVV